MFLMIDVNCVINDIQLIVFLICTGIRPYMNYNKQNELSWKGTKAFFDIIESFSVLKATLLF